MKNSVHIKWFFRLSRQEQITLAEEAKYNVRELARRLQVSPRTLEKAFLFHLGASPQRTFQHWRMVRACEELCRGTPIKVVASELSFYDPAHFSNAFHVTFGVRPSAVSRPR